MEVRVHGSMGAWKYGCMEVWVHGSMGEMQVWEHTQGSLRYHGQEDLHNDEHPDHLHNDEHPDQWKTPVSYTILQREAIMDFTPAMGDH